MERVWDTFIACSSAHGQGQGQPGGANTVRPRMPDRYMTGVPAVRRRPELSLLAAYLPSFPHPKRRGPKANAARRCVPFALPHSVLGMGRSFFTYSAGKVPGRIKPQTVDLLCYPWPMKWTRGDEVCARANRAGFGHWNCEKSPDTMVYGSRSILKSLYGDITMLHDDFKVAFAESSANGAAPEKAVKLYDCFDDLDEDDEILDSLKLLGLGPASQWATSELRDTARQIKQEHHNQGWDLRLLEWMIAQGLEGRSGGSFED